MYYDYLLNKTFENIQQDALSRVTNTIDKRQGSIIYDALAPTSLVLANTYVELYLFYVNNNLFTAAGEPLTNLCANYGIIRYPATYSTKKIVLTAPNGTSFNVQIGTKFSTISDTNPVFYTVTQKVKDGEFLAVCETIGSIGNIYSGDLLPTTVIRGLGNAYMTDVETPARDTESDDDLRDRTIEWLRRKPFGGNVQHYISWTKAINGVGAVQVYPTWNGGGTVKLSILDGSFNPAKEEFIKEIQEYFMPEPYTQKGYGTAPIGSNVTVVAPVETVIDISLELIIEQGYTVEQLRKDITNKINDYFLTIRKSWDDPSPVNTYKSTVYRSKLISALDDMPQILSVSVIKINGANADLKLIQSGTIQEVPKLGKVELLAI